MMRSTVNIDPTQHIIDKMTALKNRGLVSEAVLQQLIEQKPVHTGMSLDNRLYTYMLFLNKLLGTNIEKKLIDKLFTQSIKEFIEDDTSHYTGEYSWMLTQAAKFNLKHLLHLLLDNKRCRFINICDNDSALIYILQRPVYNHALFMKVLDKEIKRINVVTRNGWNALSFAIMHKRKLAVDELLKIANISVTDMHIKMAKFSGNLTIYEAIKSRLLHDERQFDLRLNCIQPVAMFSQTRQLKIAESILNSLDHFGLFNQNPQLKADFADFVISKQPLRFANMNNISIAQNVLVYLINPELINQYCVNTCSVITLMQNLVRTKPKRFVESVLAICVPDGKYTHALPAGMNVLHKEFGKDADFFSEVWSEVIRNHYNALFGFSNNAFFSNFTALARPEQLVRMHTDFGFTIISETMQIRFNQHSLPGRFLDTIRRTASSVGNLSLGGLVYSQFHQEILDDAARFDHLCAVAQNNHLLTILVNAEFINLMTEQSYLDSFIPPIEASHYMVISKFTYNPDNATVSFTCMTWGQLYRGQEVPRAEFEKGFLGVLVMSSAEEVKPKDGATFKPAFNQH
jgi:hypothetical protein